MKKGVIVIGILASILIAMMKCSDLESFTLSERETCRKFHNKDSAHMSEANKKCPTDIATGLPTCNGWIVAFEDNPSKKINKGNPILYQLGPVDDKNPLGPKVWKEYAKCKTKLPNPEQPFGYSLLGKSSPSIQLPTIVNVWDDIEEMYLNRPVILKSASCNTPPAYVTANACNVGLSMRNTTNNQIWKILRSNIRTDNINRYVITSEVQNSCVGVSGGVCTNDINLNTLLNGLWRAIRVNGGYMFESEMRIVNKTCHSSSTMKRGEFGCLGFAQCNSANAVLSKIGDSAKNVFYIEHATSPQLISSITMQELIEKNTNLM